MTVAYRVAPPANMYAGGREWSFRIWFNEVVMTRPFWRSKDGAALAEEIFEVLDATPEDAPHDFNKDQIDALQREVALGDVTSANPLLTRMFIKYASSVYNAEKVK